MTEGGDAAVDMGKAKLAFQEMLDYKKQIDSQKLVLKTINEEYKKRKIEMIPLIKSIGDRGGEDGDGPCSVMFKKHTFRVYNKNTKTALGKRFMTDSIKQYFKLDEPQFEKFWQFVEDRREATTRAEMDIRATAPRKKKSDNEERNGDE